MSRALDFEADPRHVARAIVYLCVEAATLGSDKGDRGVDPLGTCLWRDSDEGRDSTPPDEAIVAAYRRAWVVARAARVAHELAVK